MIPYHPGEIIQISVYFSLETTEARNKWHAFGSSTGRKVDPLFAIKLRYSLRNKGEINAFSDGRNTKEFIASITSTKDWPRKHVACND